jgi:hypothetical protein
VILGLTSLGMDLQAPSYLSIQIAIYRRSLYTSRNTFDQSIRIDSACGLFVHKL